MSKARRATRAAIESIDKKEMEMLTALSIPSAHGGVHYVTEREKHDRELLAARLLAAHLDRPRFRIRWADVLAMLGASALFVWFLLIVMEAWAG